MTFNKSLSAAAFCTSLMWLSACQNSQENVQNQTPAAVPVELSDNDQLSASDIASDESMGDSQLKADSDSAPVQTERTELANAIVAQSAIDLNGIDRELARIREELIIDQYFEKVYSDATSSEAIDSYYRTHSENYTTRGMELAHVLIRIPAKANATERAVMETKARDAHARLRSGDDFSSVAKAVSEDTATAQKGGALGWVNGEDLPDSLMQAAWSLSPGEFSTPVSTDYGIHILKALSAVQVRQRPLPEVRAHIAHNLRADAKQSALEVLGYTSSPERYR